MKSLKLNSVANDNDVDENNSEDALVDDFDPCREVNQVLCRVVPIVVYSVEEFRTDPHKKGEHIQQVQSVKRHSVLVEAHSLFKALPEL